ncbi:Hypothetical predicted protein [Olea europaea subsp. europaea]|uniref:Uncharacterized protein n=1 Tax=Olea europaea subsp. europaea TaxID=158383 RepID=A0A8S0RDX2_OLEEU|nr:Hypothetical predicted protein [Olea europaea subsp. europaea]
MKFEVLLNSVLPSGLCVIYVSPILKSLKVRLSRIADSKNVYCAYAGLNPSFLTSQKNFGQWDLMDQEDQGVAGVVDLWYRVFSWSRWVHWWVFQLNTLGDFFLLILSLPLLVATRLFWRASTFSHSSLLMEIQILYTSCIYSCVINL